MPVVVVMVVVVSGGCGVSYDDGDDPCEDNYLGSTGNILGEAWIREPADDPTETRWTPTTDHCDSNFVEKIDVSADSYIYVAGYAPQSRNCEEDELDIRCKETQWLRRLSPDYQELWSVSFDLDNTELRSFQMTADGGVVVVGANTEAPRKKPWIARYGPGGGLQWEQKLIATGHLHGVAVAANDEIIAVGQTLNQQDDDLWVIKLRGDGSEIWNTHVGTLGPDGGTAIAVDGQGRIWVTGVLGESGAGGERFSRLGSEATYLWADDGSIVALLDPDGTELWVNESEQANASAGAFAIALFPNGDALVGGHVGDGLDLRSSLTRYDPSGAKLWETVLGDRESPDLGSLAISSKGDCFAVIGRELFHLDGDGQPVKAPQRLWESTEDLKVRVSGAMTLKADDTPLISGYFESGWFFPAWDY